MSDEKKYPSLGQQAKNLAKFSWDLIQYLNENNLSPLTVSDETYKERTTICKSCNKFDDLETKCMECGCYIPAKARVIIDSCPLNKWADISDQWEEMFEDILNDLDDEKNQQA